MDFLPDFFSPFAVATLPAWVSALALLVALAVDRWLGEPNIHLHPVVWMGNYLGWGGQHLQRVARQDLTGATPRGPDSGCDFKAFWLGVLVWSAGAAMVLIVTGALQNGFRALPGWLGPVPGGVLAALLLGLLLKPMLAWAMLRDEVLAVQAALASSRSDALAAGRERLSWLVSRDVTHLSATEVRESAIESLAENLNDSVVAPIFWFVLLGLPGAALYRFANTADAMWGYRGVYKGRNWEWAGKWAARADDLLSWLPARLTGLLLALVAGGLSLGDLRTQARRTPSPNSGWPMAAMALALGVRLEKPGVYVLNGDGRAVLPADILRAVIFSSKVTASIVAIEILAIIFVAVRWAR